MAGFWKKPKNANKVFFIISFFLKNFSQTCLNTQNFFKIKIFFLKLKTSNLGLKKKQKNQRLNFSALAQTFGGTLTGFFKKGGKKNKSYKKGAQSLGEKEKEKFY